MENMGVNVWVSILVMLLVGLAIGAWQGFWIAFVHVPPFITTLAGMLVFRGLSNVVLNGLVVVQIVTCLTCLVAMALILPVCLRV